MSCHTPHLRPHYTISVHICVEVHVALLWFFIPPDIMTAQGVLKECLADLDKIQLKQQTKL